MHLLIIGHNFIRRLYDYTHSHNFCEVTPFRLKEFPESDIQWDYRGGRYLTELWHHGVPTRTLRAAMRSKPDLVYVEIGSNDVTKVSEEGVPVLSQSLSDLLQWISLQGNVKGVAWGGILPRKPDIREHIPLKCRYSM